MRCQRRRLRLPLFRFLEDLVLLYFFFEERDFLALGVRFVSDVEAFDFGAVDCPSLLCGSAVMADAGILATALPVRAASKASASKSPSRWYPAHVRWMRSPPSRCADSQSVEDPLPPATSYQSQVAIWCCSPYRSIAERRRAMLLLTANDRTRLILARLRRLRSLR